MSGVLACDVTGIGTVAGTIWKYLKQTGPVTLAKLAKSIDAPRDMIMQGVGWLAREGKVEFSDSGRARMIHLTE